MSNALRNQIRHNLLQKDTEYLLDIWQNGDPDEWDEVAFEITREILKERLGRVPPQSHQTKIPGLIKQIEEYIESEAWDKALKTCKQVIKAKPDLPLARYYLGLVYDELVQLEPARASLQEAIRLDPGLKDAWERLKYVEKDLEEEFEGSIAKEHLDRACEYVDNGQPDKALKECELAKKDLPDLAVAWNYLGLIYQGCGRLEAAIEAYLKAILMNPRFYPARTNLANARVRFEEDQYRLVAERGETQGKDVISPDIDISGIPEYTENDGLAPQWLYLPEPSFLIKGFAGYRNRQGRIGLDPLDTDFEQARIEGTIIRKLIMGRFRTRNPFYLLLMIFFGLISCLPVMGIMSVIRGDWYPGLGLISAYPVIGVGFALWVNVFSSLLNKKNDDEDNGNAFY